MSLQIMVSSEAVLPVAELNYFISLDCLFVKYW